MGEEHRSLNGADEVGGPIARLAWRGPVRAKLSCLTKWRPGARPWATLQTR
jgi:hypothetical protein